MKKTNLHFQIAFDENFQTMSVNDVKPEFDYFDEKAYLETVYENENIDSTAVAYAKQSIRLLSKRKNSNTVLIEVIPNE